MNLAPFKISRTAWLAAASIVLSAGLAPVAHAYQVYTMAIAGGFGPGTVPLLNSSSVYVTPLSYAGTVSWNSLGNLGSMNIAVHTSGADIAMVAALTQEDYTVSGQFVLTAFAGNLLAVQPFPSRPFAGQDYMQFILNSPVFTAGTVPGTFTLSDITSSSNRLDSFGDFVNPVSPTITSLTVTSQEVPEPTTAAILGVGLLAAASVRRRGRRG